MLFITSFFDINLDINLTFESIPIIIKSFVFITGTLIAWNVAWNVESLKTALIVAVFIEIVVALICSIPMDGLVEHFKRKVE